MRRKRYTNGYMIYGCSKCGRGFRVYLQENLETQKPGSKPVPFVIKCPFCGAPDCKDVFFRKFPIPRCLIGASMPAFVNDKGDECGRPIHLDRASCEYMLKPNEAAVTTLFKEVQTRAENVKVVGINSSDTTGEKSCGK